MQPVEPAAAVRVYEAQAEMTSVFGRVSCVVRQHHLVVDGPIQNGCPGEAPTPGELFLTAAAACGAEVLQVLARDAQVPLEHVAVTVPVPGLGLAGGRKRPHRGPSLDRAARSCGQVL